jgi:glycosyltransferase involved in cell wall biosynthesis
MSRIVIDAREYSTSTGRYISQLIQHLEEIDKQNEYFILLRPEDIDTYVPNNQNFQKQVCPYKEFSFGEQLGLTRQLRRLKADLVHFGMTQQPVLYRRPKITTVHDLTTARFYNPAKKRLTFTIKQMVYKWLIRRVSKQSAVVITPSGFVKDDLAAFAKINPDKITVTPEAASPITATPEPLTGLIDRQFLLYVGRPTPHKNLERLTEAFRSLRVDHPELLLVLGGKKDANYERLESEVRQQSIKGVFFTGFLNEGQLRWLYENCAAYVFPSLSEGFGLPGLEAMSHGAPVVSSNATCLPEVYGPAALYFDPQDTAAMAASINQVLTDKKKRADLIKKGYEQIKKYSWQRMSEQTHEVYRQVLNPKDRARP